MSAKTLFKGVRPPVWHAALLDAPFPFSFQPPSSIQVVGSYLLRTVTKPDLNVDVAVEMPAACIGAGDHADHSYLKRRACYLAVLAAFLRKHAMFANMQFAACDGDVNKPILVVAPVDPEGAHKTKFSIRIHVQLPLASLNWAALTPDKCNVSFDALASVLAAGSERPAGTYSTAHYNNAALADLLQHSHLQTIHGVVAEAAQGSIVEAVILLKNWLRRRDMSGAVFGVLNGFTATMLLVHLIQSRQIPRDASSYLMFRAVVSNIATSNWSAAGLAMKHVQYGPQLPTGAALPSLETFHKNFDVVFVDSSGLVNLLANMNLNEYENLKHEARLAVAALDDPQLDGFAALFIQQVPFTSKFDLVMAVDITADIGLPCCHAVPV